MAGRDVRVIVIGAGIGGLACAVDLASAGFAVRVLERAAGPGGKARRVTVGDVQIDAGPTVLTMPWVFDELFDAAGSSFRSAIALERATVLARHAWSDGTQLDLHADRQASADAIGQVFGPAEGRAYLDFCTDGRTIYEMSEGPFLRSQRPTMASIVRQFGGHGLTALAKIGTHRTMARALEQRFASPRLRQLFGRYATYCGSSPYEAPSTFNLIAHVEAEGVYRPRGGIHAVAEALATLARSLGVEIVYGQDVERIVVEDKRARGVFVNGQREAADAVVWNGDVSAFAAGLVGKDAVRAAPATKPAARSLSAVTWSMHARVSGFPLLNHNVFFSDDYPAEFDTMLGRRPRVPDAPTVYICAQDRGDSEISAPAERLLVLVNAPANGDEPAFWNESEKERCTTATLRLLRRTGLTLESLASVQTTPVDFDRMFPSTGGALYGPRAKGPLSALSRQGAESSIANLYLTGGSVHPGAGVPMAALSGRLAATQIREHLGSTGLSRRTATTGITLTG